MTASLLAVGYDLEEFQDIMGQDLSSIVLGKKRSINYRIFSPCQMKELIQEHFVINHLF